MLGTQQILVWWSQNCILELKPEYVYKEVHILSESTQYGMHEKDALHNGTGKDLNPNIKTMTTQKAFAGI